MNPSTATVTFKCKACGGTVLELPDNATDASIVHCKSCHIEIGSYGDLKSAAKDVIGKEVQKELKKVFKDFPKTIKIRL